MDQETIFVETDPAFNVVLQALVELRNQDRLQLTNLQTESLEDIESNDRDENSRLKFGGKNGPSYAYSAFGKTASAVVRMCMLGAVGVSKNYWPKAGNKSDERNKGKLRHEILRQPHFCLAHEQNAARFYYSKYDQIYPPSRIQHELRQVDLNKQVKMSSMMLIFRRNFTEVVEISTTFTATPKENQQFKSYIHVICAVRKITGESSAEHPDGQFTKLLRKLIESEEISDAHVTRMTEIEEGDDLDGLLDDLSTLNLNDESE